MSSPGRADDHPPTPSRRDPANGAVALVAGTSVVATPNRAKAPSPYAIDATERALPSLSNWRFFLSVAPWRFKRATHLAVNPLAMF